jgi:hypothetical protein|tara:strand:+ start:418 stop:717 length:300 start_codon:yes stop_codon:yes gene_type:complete
MNTQRKESKHEYGVLFWVGTVIGWAIIIYGARLLLADDEAEWFNTVWLVAIGIIANDIVWLGVSVGGGWLLSRMIGREIPFWIRRYGDRMDNATILPQN